MFQLRWIVLAIILSSMLLPAHFAQAEEIEASVEVLERGVEVMELGTKEWQTLESDALVSAGDRIRTDETGYALITWFEDGTFIEIQPNSELVIEEFSAEGDKFIIDASLLQGSILNSVRRLINQDSGYHINTSNLTAAVRGTVFSVSINADMSTTIAVVEGTVHAENPTNPDIFVPVTAGNMLTVASSEEITASTVAPTQFDDVTPEYAEIITTLDDFYENLDENLPDEDSAPENGDTNGGDTNNNGNNGNNGGGNGNGNNGNGNGNGGSNGNSNNGNGNTGGNNSGANGNGNNGNGNGNGGGNGNGNNGNGNGNGNNGNGNGNGGGNK